MKIKKKPRSRANSLAGVSCLFDADGNPAIVQIDLRKNRELWEDIFDAALSEKRLKEPRVDLDAVEKRLRQLGKLS